MLIPASLGLMIYTLAPPNLVHGDYIVEETNPFGRLPLDISDYFNSDDLNPSDKNTAVDNSIGVELALHCTVHPLVTVYSILYY